MVIRHRITKWNDDAAAGPAAAARGTARRAGPLFELRASVPNRPGVIAELALELGRSGVNITDMALYPAADMTEGVVALWIAGEEAAQRTEKLVGGTRVSGGARMIARFAPSGPLRGSLRVAGDKSVSHRAAIFGAMASEPVRISGYPRRG